jgi:methyl-accepting chemotaxis protein
MRALADGVEKIGQAVGLITSIAGETNLLALNANVEAARDGDANKGFAVVVSEVKDLASQTAKVTDEIDAQIREIQEATKEALGAIENIVATVNEISTIANTIASMIAEQGSAVAGIACDVQQAVRVAQEMTENISGVIVDANGTCATAAAPRLAQQAEQLSAECRMAATRCLVSSRAG